MRDKDDPKFGTKKGVKDDDFMIEVRDRYELACDATNELYRKSLDDMKFAFVPDNQWDDWMVKARGTRPRYEFNKLRQALKQVTNDQRQNRPQVKVRAVEDGDKDMAEVRQGLIRNIEATSNADRAYDTAFQFAVGGGFGCWRVETAYADEGSFDQDIRVREVANPYSIRFDPAAREKDRRDGRFAFVEEDVPRSEFKARYPKADMVEFESTDARSVSWWDDDTIKVAEYWYKEATKKTIVQLSDGRVVNADSLLGLEDDLAAAGITEQDRREIESYSVKQCIVSGTEILDGPNEWPGKFIPIVPVWGDILNLEGRDEFCGMVRFSKDAQRAYNYERSIFIETISKQPRSPLMATPAMIEGFESTYESIGSEDPPVLLYNPDPTAPSGRPTREPPPSFPAALANAAQISADDIKATTGIYDASLGARSNETSGKAILARQREGDVSSFDYIDNLGYAQKYSYEVISDLIPHIMNTARQVRIIGDDGAEKVMKVNQPVFDQQTQQWVTVNDVTGGKFDIAVTIGPSFTTQRMETADAMLNLSNDPSPLGLLAKYAFIDSLDTPGMDTIRKAARKVLVGMGLMEPEEGEPQEQPQGPPPEVQQAMQQVQEQGQQVQQAMQELQQAQAAMDKQRMEIESAIKAGHSQDMVEKANMQTQRAQLDAQADKLDAARQILEARFNELQAKLAASMPPVDALEAAAYVQSAQAQMAETMQALMQPPPDQFAPNQPPEGGFLLPDGTEPDGFPGQSF